MVALLFPDWFSVWIKIKYSDDYDCTLIKVIRYIIPGVMSLLFHLVGILDTLLKMAYTWIEITPVSVLKTCLLSDSTVLLSTARFIDRFEAVSAGLLGMAGNSFTLEQFGKIY